MARPKHTSLSLQIIKIIIFITGWPAADGERDPLSWKGNSFFQKIAPFNQLS